MRTARFALAALCLAGIVALAAAPAFAQDELDSLLEGASTEPGDEEAGETGTGPATAEEPGADDATSDEATYPEESAGVEAAADTVVPPPPTTAVPAPPRRRVIEEIIVTAQKREQSILDVPIAMSVLTGDVLADENVTDLRDVTLYVPNATIDNNGQFNDVRIRGLGSPLSNKAFEQSVGLVLDGIPYGRREYFVGPIFDIDRVEVLRGPQGTLFGKNTTAGLFNILTNRPTDQLTGFVDAEVGELGRRRFELGVGGAVVPGWVNFRLSGLLDERDGLVKNTSHAVSELAHERGGSRQRQGIRAQLGFPSLFGVSLNLQYQFVDVDLTGGSWEFHSVNPDHVDFYRFWDPNTDFEPGNWIGSQDSNSRNFQKLHAFVGDASYDLFGWDLDAVFGHAVLNAGFSESDADFSPAPMFLVFDQDRNPQTTFELRSTSPLLEGLLGLGNVLGFDLGTSELTLGLFHQRRAIEDSAQAIGLNVPVLAQFLVYQAAPFEEVPPLESLIGQTIGLGGLGAFELTEDVGFEETTGFFSQKGESYAGFGQLDWHFLERWTLQYGMRLTSESKEATNARETTAGSGVAFQALGLRPFQESLSRDEFAFTPKVALRHDWTEEISAFASWGRGFKSGGFNELASNNDDLSNLQFEPERTTAWELGTKMRLLGGIANLNLSLFRLTAEDLQVFTVQPSTAIVSVTNAGEARSQGLEADGVWLPLDWLSFRGTLAYTDSEFLEFPFGTCTGDRPDTDGDGDDRCDLTGQPLFRTPKWVTNLGTSARYPMASLPFLPSLPYLEDVDLLANFSGIYKDVHYVDRTFDPRTRQPSFFKFNGGFGFANEAQGWSARFNVENITNEATVVQRREVTLSAGYVPGAPDFAQILEPQRLFFGSFRWSF